MGKRIIQVMFLFLFVGLFCVVGWSLQFAGRVAEGGREETVTVIIPVGTALSKINSILASEGLVDEDLRFLVVARYLGLAAKLQAGEFALHRGQTPGELLAELATARPVQHAVTIPEGLTIPIIADIFARGGWCDREEFLRLAGDPAFLEGLGLSSVKTLEGYLYPDTYYLTRRAQTTADILRMQVRKFFTVWETIKETAPLGLSPYEVLILASMVEKEAARASERPIIAGVFINRLKKGMRMQSDPTVMYGIKGFSGSLSRKDLRTPTPYNTYVIKGLPVAPISNPGKAALESVLHPTPSNFFYFVSKNNGTHLFSRTLREHNRGVQRYQRARKKRVRE